MKTSALAILPGDTASAPWAARHKVVITGTGRAGTTFLVRLLTALELDTGYSNESWRADYFTHCAAGLERDITDPGAPYIVKDPELCVTLGGLLEAGHVVVDHAIVPVRDLESAALSRVRIGGADGVVPGGLVGTDDPFRQQAVLAERFHALVHTLVGHDIPHTFLAFPRVVHDAEYAFAKLRIPFPELDRARFMAAFAAIADPSLVHELRGRPPARAASAIRFESARNGRRRRRRLWRGFGWIAVAVLVCAAIGWLAAR